MTGLETTRGAEALAGRYLIDGELGRGGTGRVLRVRDRLGLRARGMPLALKVLEDPAQRDDFLREYERARSLAHPAFVEALGLVSGLALPEGLGPALAREARAGAGQGRSVEGAQVGAKGEVLGPAPGHGEGRPLVPPGAKGEVLGALYGLAEGRPLAPERAPEQALAVARWLIGAIDHLHRKGFVHGDLAPSNVVWREAPELGLTILDLGAGGREGERGGSTRGVLAYVAPERLRGAPLSVAGDLWSIGALVYGLAHGRHPFPGYPARVAALAPPELPHVLDPWLTRLLALDPAARHPSAAVALAELEALAEVGPSWRPRWPRVEICARWEGVAGEVAEPSEAVAETSEGRSRTELARGAEGVGEAAAEPSEAGRWAPPESAREGAAAERRPELSTAVSVAEVASWLVGAARRRSPQVLELAGAAGSGKSVALGALGDRLIAEGVLVLDLPAVRDEPEAWLQSVLLALGWTDLGGGEATLVTALGRAVLAAQVPVCLLVDELARAPSLRATLGRLAQAMTSVPERFGPLLVVGELGREEVDGRLTLRPWAGAAVASLLEATWPGRTVLAADVEALVQVSRGLPGLLTATLETALNQGALEVDSSTLAVDRDALAQLAPESFEAVAYEALAALPEPLVQLATLAASTRFPLPGASALVEAGVGVPVAGGVRLASEALARAAREHIVAPEAVHAELARRFAERPTVALAHRLWAGEAVEVALAGLEPDDEAAFLLEALAQRPGWPGTAETALAAARLHERRGRGPDLEAALALYGQAATLAHDAASAAEAALGEGRLGIRLGRYPGALEAFERALAGVTAGGRRLEVEAGLARAAVLSGRLDQAQEVADAALKSANMPASIVAKLLYVRALVDWYRGDFDSASPRLSDALSASREAEDLVEQAAIVTAQGLVAHRRADLARAASFYAEALSLGQKAHDEGRVLTALQNLGVVRHELGQWTEALDTYRHALALAEAQGARAKVAQLAGNLGNLWRYLGETERAAQVLRRGYEVAVADKYHHLHALTANLLGDVESDRGALALAQRWYEEALAVATEHGFEPERLECGLNLGRLLCERMELDRAEAVLESALAQAERHEGLRLQLVGVRAQLLRRRGQTAAARAAIGEALAGVERLKNPDQRWPIFLEATLIARDAEVLDDVRAWSVEVRRVLQGQLDNVPGRHREAFGQRRDRRAAGRETALFVVEWREGPQPRALGWTRLLEVQKRLAGEHNVQRLLEYIMDSAILLSGAERGFLLLEDEGQKEGLEVKVARNLDQENIRKRHLKISRGIARRVIATGEAVVTIDAMEDERYREQLSVVDLRLRSILCLPMSLRGRVLGAIYLDNRFRTSVFSDEDLGLMEAFADMAGIALGNARLLESLETQAKAMAAARGEIEALNERLAAELSRRTQELEDTKVAILEERRSQSQQFGFEHIIGGAPNMRRVFQVVERVTNTSIAVLVEGESGTGKELVARAIHFAGVRKERPFVAVNCGAIPATLLESELFGHVRGAFTGATADKKGLFEVAHTGTLFLDEIGEMPLEMQVKLLRVLQSGELQKVGATKQVTVDVRIVAATNRRLEEEVRAGRFREDLYYRLSVVPIVVPPLRERREDIPLLVQHFLDENRKAGLGRVTGISKEALAMLQRYAWPGNVRQLEMVLKNATVFAEGELLTASDLASFPDIVGASAHGGEVRGVSFTGQTLAELERMAIVATLRELKGNKKRSAELLGIDRRTLYNKLAAYEIAIDSELRVK